MELGLALTQEQEKGTRFEVWLEILFKRLGYKNIRRNLEVHESKYVFRQVDLCYKVNKKPIIIEAKYSSNGNIRYKLRKKVDHKAGETQRIYNNLVDEMIERMKFVKSEKGILVTNKYFDEKVEIYAPDYLHILDRDSLTELYSKAGGRLDIDSSIQAIDVDKYDLKKKYVKEL